MIVYVCRGKGGGMGGEEELFIPPEANGSSLTANNASLQVIQQIKIAFCLKIAALLEAQEKITCQVALAYMDIAFEGYTFRLYILSVR